MHYQFNCLLINIIISLDGQIGKNIRPRQGSSRFKCWEIIFFAINFFAMF